MKRDFGSCVSAAFISDRIGVMPLPPAKATYSRCACWIELPAKAAVRRHHIEDVAGFEFVIDPAGKGAAGDFLDADLQRPFGRRDADGIIAPELFAADFAAEREVLAGFEFEGLAQLVRQLKPHRHRIRRFAFHFRDLELVKVNSRHQ